MNYFTTLHFISIISSSFAVFLSFRPFLSMGLKEKARNEEKILKNNIKSILPNTGSTKNTKSSPKTALTEKTAFRIRYKQ